MIFSAPANDPPSQHCGVGEQTAKTIESRREFPSWEFPVEIRNIRYHGFNARPRETSVKFSTDGRPVNISDHDHHIRTYKFICPSSVREVGIKLFCIF